ncbi:hypothetical protein APHAL10511_003960 [Amanita phalloides]|nr:hypothetical protein APHAL10511_003960 [Amanita phalloides]
MAPTRSSGSTRSSSLRQGTLTFASTKRTASTSTAGKPTKVVKSVVASIPSSSESSPSSSEKSSPASVFEDDDGPLQQPSRSYKRREKEDSALRPAKRRHVSSAPEAAPKPQSHAAEEIKDERPRLNPKDRRWTKLHAAAKKRMDYPTPIHSENQNKIHEILRVFDLSYEYGPCVGMSRIERWERAHAMGLNPPQEIQEILMTADGMDKEEFSQSVLYGEV